jgi:hypothetical protein
MADTAVFRIRADGAIDAAVSPAIEGLTVTRVVVDAALEPDATRPAADISFPTGCPRQTASLSTLRTRCADALAVVTADTARFATRCATGYALGAVAKAIATELVGGTADAVAGLVARTTRAVDALVGSGAGSAATATAISST